MTGAERRRVQRAIAGALAGVDELWSPDAFERLVGRCGRDGCEVLRELIIQELAGELELGLDAGLFEVLLEAARMTA